MNPPLLWTMRLAAVALLLGSFPVQQVWGPVPCDIMRLGGFLLVLLLAVRAWIAQRGKPGPKQGTLGRNLFFLSGALFFLSGWLGGSPSFYAVGLCFFVLGLNAGREDK